MHLSESKLHRADRALSCKGRQIEAILQIRGTRVAFLDFLFVRFVQLFVFGCVLYYFVTCDIQVSFNVMLFIIQ